MRRLILAALAVLGMAGAAQAVTVERHPQPSLSPNYTVTYDEAIDGDISDVPPHLVVMLPGHYYQFFGTVNSNDEDRFTFQMPSHPLLMGGGGGYGRASGVFIDVSGSWDTGFDVVVSGVGNYSLGYGKMFPTVPLPATGFLMAGAIGLLLTRGRRRSA